MIIDGKKIAQEIYEEIKSEIQNLEKKPRAVAVLVGENPSSKVYIAQKKKWAEYVGIEFECKQFQENITEQELLKEIDMLNKNIHIHGYIVQLPLPHHINTNTITMAIAAEKDIDGFHPTNQGNTILGGNVLFTPCTPGGIMEIFQREKIELEGKIVTIIGRSNIVGKPITNLLMNAGATVINCNKETPEDFLGERTKESDIVIVAAGVPHLLKADMINNKTIVIDVGITKKEDGKLYGDADFDNIISQGNHITPVPGGVGPMTVAMLMRNTLKAYQEQNKK